jgi:hypothetical protein
MDLVQAMYQTETIMARSSRSAQISDVAETAG